MEFSPRCGTAQVEDLLKLYIPSAIKEIWDRQYEDFENDSLTPLTYWKVFRTLRGGTTWPQDAVVLPGLQTFRIRMKLLLKNMIDLILFFFFSHR